MLRTLIAAGIAVAAVAGGPASAADQGVTDTEILLGSVIPLTGPPALLGVAHTTGVKVAIAEANAAGGVNGRKIRLIMDDDGYIGARTIQATRKLIDVDKVFAIPGHSGSGQVLAAMPVLDKSGIPTIASVGPVKGMYEPPRKNVFAVGSSYEEGIRVLVRFLAEKNPGKTWGLITQDDDYGVAVRDGFEDVAKERKLNVVYSASYKRGQQDFSSEMVRLKDAGVEVFLAGGIISENVAMVKELEKLAIKPVVGIFWPGRVEAVLKLMGPASDGIYAVDYVEPFASPAGQAFLDKAKGLVSEAEFKSINRYTMSGYAGARVLISAMTKCGRDLTWACANREIEATKDLKTGVMAPMSFGPNVRFTNSKLQIMQADYATLSYKPVK